MSYETHLVDTPEGPVFHLEISESDFLSVHPGGQEDTFSWTGNCSASQFLALGAEIPGETTVITPGQSMHGDTEEIVSRVRNLSAVNECDFIRFTWPTASLEWQRFPHSQGRSGLTLITAVGENLYLRNIYLWVHETATELVIAEVDAALSEVNTASQYSQEI